MNDVTEPERFLKLDEVKRRAGLGKSMIYRLIQEGKFSATGPSTGVRPGPPGSTFSP